MKEISYEVKDSLGIHARPAGLLVKKAAAFQSDITISKNDKSADLKKMLAVMSLGVKQGNTIVIKISGEDEDEAFDAIKEFLDENL